MLNSFPTSNINFLPSCLFFYFFYHHALFFNTGKFYMVMIYFPFHRQINIRKNNRAVITVIQVYATTTNAKDAEVEWFDETLQELLELTPKKRYPFHHKGLECKSRKSGDTWSNRQVWPWSTK